MKKIVLIGAGSQNFGLGVIGDIFKSKTLDYISQINCITQTKRVRLSKLNSAT